MIAAPVEIADSFGVASQAVAWLKARLAPGVSIETHPGTYDLAALKRFGAAAPAVRVSTLGFGQPLFVGDGRADLPVKVSAAIVTATRGQLTADQAANALATAVALAVGDEQVGVANGFPVTELRAQNEYSGTLAEVGGSIALWQVTWTQRVRFGAADTAWDGPPAALDAALRLSELVVFGTGAPADGLAVTGGGAP